MQTSFSSTAIPSDLSFVRREEEMKRRIEKFIAAIVFQEERGEGGV